MSVENKAASSYVTYWSVAGDREARWDQLYASVKDQDIGAVAEMVREMYAHAYKQGFLLRLTGADENER